MPFGTHLKKRLMSSLIPLSFLSSSEKTQLMWAGRHLETDVCVAGQQAPDPDVIQNYVKKVTISPKAQI